MWAGACETFNPAVDQAGAPTNWPIGLFWGTCAQTWYVQDGDGLPAVDGALPVHRAKRLWTECVVDVQVE